MMRTDDRRSEQGFTLIELMAVAAISVVLAVMALPSYGRYLQRARRSDGQQILLQVAAAEERYYANYNRYADLATVGFIGSPLYSASRLYQLALSVQNNSSFTATATPVADRPQASDDCGALSISSSGARGAAGTTRNGRCW